MRSSTALPELRAAPDEAQRRGARVLHRGDADELESDPAAAAAAARQPGRPRRRVRCSRRSAARRRTRHAEGAWHATPPPTDVVSTVGAGDSSLFGYLLGDDREALARPRLALAVAYGSAAAGLPGTTIPHPVAAPPELVSVRQLNLTLGG